MVLAGHLERQLHLLQRTEPGCVGLYRSAGDAAAALKASLATSPTLALSPVAVTDQYTIFEVFRGGLGPPGVHPGWTELHFILEGRGVFVTGGRIVIKADGTSTLEGGTGRQVTKGDAVVVPANTPHQYTEVDGLRALEARFVTSETRPPAK